MSASQAQLSSETNSWACMHLCQLGSYLVFLFFIFLSWLQAPLGALSAWKHRGSPGPSPLHTTYSILFERGSLELLLAGAVVSYNGIASWWVVFILLPWWNPNSQPLPPDRSSWQKKGGKQQGQPQRAVAAVACTESSNTTQNKQLFFYHNTLILSSSDPSADSPHPGGCNDRKTVNFWKRLIVQWQITEVIPKKVKQVFKLLKVH